AASCDSAFKNQRSRFPVRRSTKRAALPRTGSRGTEDAFRRARHPARRSPSRVSWRRCRRAPRVVLPTQTRSDRDAGHQRGRDNSRPRRARGRVLRRCLQPLTGTDALAVVPLLMMSWWPRGSVVMLLSSFAASTGLARARGGSMTRTGQQASTFVIVLSGEIDL